MLKYNYAYNMVIIISSQFTATYGYLSIYDKNGKRYNFIK